MRVGFCWITALLFAGEGLLALPSCALAQKTNSSLIAAAELPEAPQAQQSSISQSQANPQPSPNATPAQGSSSSPAAAPQPAAKSQRQKAEEQIKEQEKQRVVGVLPSFK